MEVSHGDLFDEEDIMPIVDDIVLKPPSIAPDVEKLAWQKACAKDNQQFSFTTCSQKSCELHGNSLHVDYSMCILPTKDSGKHLHGSKQHHLVQDELGKLYLHSCKQGDEYGKIPYLIGVDNIDLKKRGRRCHKARR